LQKLGINGSINNIKWKTGEGIMKRNYFDLIKGAVGIGLCIIAVLGIYYWETFGRIEYTKRDVIVLSESLKPLTIITKEDLVIVKRDISDLIDDPITNADDIIGKVSKHYIPAKVQLSQEFFEKDGLLPNEGEYIFQMPSDWIASMPSTLRRSDDAYLYPVKKLSGDFDVDNTSDSADPVKCLRIAFVRNQSNQEVQSVGDSDRLDANSSISNIELIVTLEDIEQLNEMRNDGYKFIVMYK